MKKILLGTLLAAFALTGCLKDKGYEDQKYGMEIVEMPAVAFPQAASSPVALSLTSQTTPAVADGPTITLEIDGNAPSDVQVTLQVNNALVSAAGLTPLPTTATTFSSLTVTIPAGQKMAKLPITFPNTSSLNPALSYGIGFTIASVSGGYKIAANQKNIVYSISVKNKYDGVYQLVLRLDGWEAYGIASGVSGTYPANFELITAGPDAVTINALAPSTFGDIQPGFTGGLGSITGSTGFGAAGPKYTFNSTTNKVVSVTNTYPDDGRGRAFYLSPTTTTSQWDPTTKRIFVEYYMKQNGRPDQKITTTYNYLRAR